MSHAENLIHCMLFPINFCRAMLSPNLPLPNYEDRQL